MKFVGARAAEVARRRSRIVAVAGLGEVEQSGRLHAPSSEAFLKIYVPLQMRIYSQSGAWHRDSSQESDDAAAHSLAKVAPATLRWQA